MKAFKNLFRFRIVTLLILISTMAAIFAWIGNTRANYVRECKAIAQFRELTHKEYPVSTFDQFSGYRQVTGTKRW